MKGLAAPLTVFVARRLGRLALIPMFLIGSMFAARAGNFLALEPNSPRYVDLIVILGGGWEARTAAGGALMRDGWARQVLLTGMPPMPRKDEERLRHPRYRYLRSLGVSREAILLDSSADSTWADVLVIRNVLEQNDWRSVLIVSDPPHLRRLRWVCERILSASNIDYRLIASRPYWWNEDRWWENKISASFVLKEFMKLFYYRVKYV